MSRLGCYLGVTLATFFWGSAFVASKLSVEAIPPFTAATLRFGLAALILVVLCLITERTGWQQARRQVGILTLLGLLGITGFAGFLFWGLAHTSAINGSMIMGTNPLMVMLLTRLFFQESISRRQGWGAALGVLGVVVVVSGGSWEAVAHLQLNRGDGLVLLANICWALYTVLVRKVHNVTPMVLTTVSTCTGAVGLALVALGEHGLPAVRAATPQIWAAIGYLAMFASVLAFLFWNWGISVLGAHRTSIFFNLVPLFAVLASVAMGGSVLFSQWVGGGIIVAGVLTATGILRIG